MRMAEYTERKVCRGCQANLPAENLVDLGAQTIVDFLANGEEGRGAAPLELVQCKTCALLQLRHTVKPDTLYRTFWYRSGINEQMRRALKDVVDAALMRVFLKPGDVVCDIGSNDGTMLAMYPEDIRKVGFEPAEQLAEESMKLIRKNVQIVDDYFGRLKAQDASHGKKYKVVTAIAMFYDLDHPLEFLRDVAAILHDEGIFIVQMNYLGLMIRNMAFDNIGHEHLCYYSLTSLMPLFKQAGLAIVDVEINDVNGGSFRVYAKRSQPELHVEDIVDVMLQEEKEHLSAAAMKSFSGKVGVISGQLVTFLVRMNSLGRLVYAYGASTRGSTLLQTIFKNGQASTYLCGVAERDEHKIGKKTAGTGLRIVSEEDARAKADYFLILPYHFWPSIAQREKKWMGNGGKAILPLPYPRVVTVSEETIGLVLVTVELEKEMGTW